ncbi:MAG: peptide-methionine (S)-S-oxide reductase MsrA [Verrucomicrobiae bacterium]|nr:peptide-methionine (S)-S-oxide reductase MsrA [Verrucomicrobiae bacterium]
MKPTLLLLTTLILTLFPGPAMNAESKKSTPTASLVLGGGCFWCTEAVMELQPGVLDVVSGYAGGKNPNPSYEEVCTGKSGHAEVIKIDYDPSKTSIEKLLEVFWKTHDPTTLNRQGADTGTQYRSVVYYSTDAEKAEIEKSRTEAQKQFFNKIVTEISPLPTFYPAEAYHQDYFRNNPGQGYCKAVIAPKVKKAREMK